jgi:chromatin remodeling complex protein RSC6
MIKTFTQTDLVRYLYREITEEESREIDRALLCDNELKALFNELRSMLDEIDAADLQPSPVTVQNILSYSRSLQEKQR